MRGRSLTIPKCEEVTVCAELSSETVRKMQRHTKRERERREGEKKENALWD